MSLDRRKSSRMTLGMSFFLVVIIAVYFVFSNQKISEEANKQLDDYTKSITQSLNKDISNYSAMAELIAGSRELFYNDILTLPLGNNSTFAEVLKDENIDGVYCIDLNGRISGLSKDGVHDGEKSTDPWIKDLLTNKNLSGTKIHKSVFNDKIVLTILKPVVTTNNVKFEGVAGVDVDIWRIWNKLQNEYLKTPGHFIMAVDNDMTVLIHPDSKLIGKSVDNSKVFSMSADKHSGNATFFGGEPAYFKIIDFERYNFKMMSVIPVSAIKKQNFEKQIKRIVYILCVAIIGFVATQTIRFFQKRFISVKQKIHLQSEISKMKQDEEMKSDFFAISIFETQTSLDAMIGVAISILDRATLTTETRNSMYTIVTTGRRIINILGNIGNFTDKKYGQMEVILNPLNIRGVVDDVVHMLSPSTVIKKVKLTNMIDESFPNVLANNEKMEQALINIVSNSIKNTYDGEIVIEAKIEDYFAHFIVRDNGRGIPKEKMETINAALKSPSEKLDPDLGIGLNIAKRIIKKHGGKIWIESEIDIGSKTHFTLQLEDSKDIAMEVM